MSTAIDLIRLLPADYLSSALRQDVRHGLTSNPKTLPPKWLYDARGSELFEEITRLPEYPNTRAERTILTTRSADIAAATQARTLIELGSGSSDKTRLLIEALRDRDTLRDYMPVDISPTALREAGRALAVEYPGLAVHAVLADFTATLELPPTTGPRLVAFLGGTYGNLLPGERITFLSSLRSQLAGQDALLLGVDLVKDPAALTRAYDDAGGITAAFSRNVLVRINTELGGAFDPDAFDHIAYWDADREWIEMRLRSRRFQVVTLRSLDLVVRFDVDEDVRTEVSAKFRPDGVAGELAAAGLALTHWWTDPHARYGVALAIPAHQGTASTVPVDAATALSSATTPHDGQLKTPLGAGRTAGGS